jgi:hypothetical protein
MRIAPNKYNGMRVKKLITLISILATSMPVMAQYTYGEPVEGKKAKKSMSTGPVKPTRFGLFFAPNNSWMKATASKSNDGMYIVDASGSKVGYSWGLMIDHFFDDNYGIATGAQLSTMGGIVNATYNTAVLPLVPPTNLVKSAEFDYRLQYFEIPVNLKLMSDNLPGGIRVFGNLGVTAAINISKKTTYTVTYTDTSATAPGGTKDKIATGENEKLRGGLSITPILFQMNLGGGMEYSLTDKLSLYVGLFFNNGFAPDVTSPKDINMNYKGEFTDGNIRLNSLNLKVGMFF